MRCGQPLDFVRRKERLRVVGESMKEGAPRLGAKERLAGEQLVKQASKGPHVAPLAGDSAPSGRHHRHPCACDGAPLLLPTGS